MKKLKLTLVMAALCLFFNQAKAQTIQITGVINDNQGNTLSGATIQILNQNAKTTSKTDGTFNITSQTPEGTLKVSYLGYQSKEIQYNSQLVKRFMITLEENNTELKQIEIISTGYQTIDRSKTAGSYVQIDNKLLNRSVSTNILDRIKDIAPGIYFSDKDPGLNTVSRTKSGNNLEVNIRGESTYGNTTNPLIVVDNFPYEGELKNLNPSDIESITILKDAASAAIWGANSANGVIVITTKKGKLNQKMNIEFSSTLTATSKPDIFYSPNYLPAASYIEVEKLLYQKGYFQNQINDNSSYPTVSPAVELLIKQSSATSQTEKDQIQLQIDALGKNDVREDYHRYVYQTGLNQQYALGLRGGTEKNTYSISFGHDQNKSSLIRNGYRRTTVNLLNTYKPIKKLELSFGMNYSQNSTIQNNNFGFGSYLSTGSPYSKIFPYATLMNADGSPSSLTQGLRSSYINSTASKGFLDWNYRPLEEIKLADNTIKVKDLLLRFQAKYQILPELNLQVNYQNEHQQIYDRRYRSAESYEARNLVNKFTSIAPATGVFTYIFPKGGLLDLYNSDWNQNNLRAQINYDKHFSQHELSLLAGAELKDLQINGYNRTSYGYEDQFGTSVSNLNYATFYPVNPSGLASIPAPNNNVSGTTNRNISYFALANYIYQQKYILNFSARQDGANLYGAKTNDKFKPFLSAGLGWKLDREQFYQLKWLPQLTLRASYGYQGNTNQSSSPFLSGVYTTDSRTGAPYILVNNAPNPRLQWENVKNINIGLDFASKNNTISGTIEFYKKNGNNLIQPTAIPPQTGFSTYQANTASRMTKGIDINLQSQNLRGALKWNTYLLLSQLKDKVVKYDLGGTSSPVIEGTINSSNLVIGKPYDALYSYKWAGLNPINGNPQGYLNGQPSEDYTAIIRNFNPDSLQYEGSKTPTIYGAIRNEFTYKGLSLSVNISYRLAYVFRRTTTSINYTDIINFSQHKDYTLRWQKQGDEMHSSVPSMVYPSNTNRNDFYQGSSILVQPGDHIRLQDIKLSYAFDNLLPKKLKVTNLTLFAYTSNLGIIWRKNKLGLDPSAVGNSDTVYPNPFTFSIGINTNF